MTFKLSPLGTLLTEKGYIRGPFGSALKRQELKESGIPVYEQQQAIDGHRRFRFFVDASKHEELKRFTVAKNDLIVSCSGTVGRISVIEDGDPIGIISQALLILRPKAETLLPRFLYYFLQSPQGKSELLNASHGAVQLNIAPRSVVEKIPTPVPEIREQIRIVQTLKALDDRISLLRDTNATLEAIAQALFKSWFVDFDPVCAKQEGQAPEGMDEATAALFPDSFDESAQELVPNGWAISTVGKSFILTMGQSPPGDTYNRDGNGLAFYQGRTDFGFRFPTQRMYCPVPARIAEMGDTLVSVRAPVGDVNMAIEKCCIGRGVSAVRSPNGYKSFTFYAMRNLGKRFENFDSEGTIFGSINKKDFQSLPVIAPSPQVLGAFDRVVAPIDDKIVESETQIRVLSSLRDTLLPRLISGQLRIADVESAVEEAIA